MHRRYTVYKVNVTIVIMFQNDLNVWSGNCPFGELSSRGVVRVGNRPGWELSVGELSVGELSVGELSVGESSGHPIFVSG